MYSQSDASFKPSVWLLQNSDHVTNANKWLNESADWFKTGNSLKMDSWAKTGLVSPSFTCHIKRLLQRWASAVHVTEFHWPVRLFSPRGDMVAGFWRSMAAAVRMHHHHWASVPHIYQTEAKKLCISQCVGVPVSLFIPLFRDRMSQQCPGLCLNSAALSVCTHTLAAHPCTACPSISKDQHRNQFFSSGRLIMSNKSLAGDLDSAAARRWPARRCHYIIVL